jgi:hypothetical protein
MHESLREKERRTQLDNNEQHKSTTVPHSDGLANCKVLCSAPIPLAVAADIAHLVGLCSVQTIPTEMAEVERKTMRVVRY